ncbi:lysine exporter LysO family protein [Paraherbaspirillum soli]|uniref:Lysine exporter LysO family protein n=1 Tax=Paraherbaspirillum soli TaxID=631222 RepID=A0ABW0MAH8_9BURK
MQAIFHSIFPILIALVIGYGAGRLLPQEISTLIGKLINPFVWLLLFAIGYDFGNILGEPSAAWKTFYIAISFAFLTTIIPWYMIFFFVKSKEHTDGNTGKRNEALKYIWSSLIACSIALTMVLCGIFVSKLELAIGMSMSMGWLPSTDILLYTLIFIVGVDCVGVKLDPTWISAKILAIPVLVIIGSLAGGCIAYFITGENIRTSLALSSGFGWFTLSGVLVSSKLGESYGAIALLIDLFRELIAILLLYTTGAHFSQACIGASGATALDSTLPIIKQTCSPSSIPIALTSGLILTLFAPFLISFFLSK